MKKVISPIFYNGCKRRILDSIIPLFPKEIDTFFDLFGGSGIVSMNVKANHYFLNDIDIHLFELYNAYKDYDSNTIIQHIQTRIKEFDLPLRRTTNNKQEQDKYKPCYIKLRDLYNEKHNVLDFITLCFFSFSQQFRFNGDKFNMPIGNGVFSEGNKLPIVNGCSFFSQSNLTLSNKSIFDIDLNIVNLNDFVYLDPPYFNTTATYNENSGWTFDEESKLLSLLDELTKRGVKWSMSNVLQCKGKSNTHLLEWIEKQCYNVEHLHIEYTAFGKGNSQNDEVLIMNYEPQIKFKQLSLFD